MPRTSVLNQDFMVDEAPVVSHEIHHIIRTISRTNMPNEGAETAQQVEVYINSWLHQGWTLMGPPHLMVEKPEGWEFLYFLYR